MVRMVRWLVAVVVLFFLLSEGIPWVRNQVDGITKDSLKGRELPPSEGPQRCVHLVEDVNAYIGVQVRDLRGPSVTDPEEWANTSQDIDQRLRDAEFSCSCPGSACEHGRAALGEMDTLVRSVDEMVTGSGAGSLNLAHLQESIDALIGQARGAASHSSTN